MTLDIEVLLGERTKTPEKIIDDLCLHLLVACEWFQLTYNKTLSQWVI